MSTDDPVQLLFDPSLKIAGQDLEGAVDLYWPGIQEKDIDEVVLKLRGTLSTYVIYALPITRFPPVTN